MTGIKLLAYLSLQPGTINAVGVSAVNLISLSLPVVPTENTLIKATRDVPTGSVHDIEYIIYVDPDEYFLSPIDERHTVARVIGNLNRMLYGKRFILIGPGRWGSNKVELGVPTTYSEICNTAMLIEVAHGRYAPEVSFGTHFFQDLIEDGILYVPVFPGERSLRGKEST